MSNKGINNTPARTKKANNFLIKYFWLYLALNCVAYNALATSLEELIASEQLTIKTNIQQQPQQIVGQALIITIEVATNRWFAKGTHLKHFALTDAIILNNTQTSTNGTQQVAGQTWVTQTHDITLYPTRQGEYTLPSITVAVSVNSEDDGIIEGVIKTTPQKFFISLPDKLLNIEHFIVSSAVNVQISGESESEKAYEIGEAIVQKITITSENSPAMMIPPLQIQTIPGLSIYPKTPQVFDKANRGELIGTRIESLTYIFEQAGRYHIPKQLIYWWNTQTNDLQTITIPSLTFNVANNSTKKQPLKNKNIPLNSTHLTVLVLITILSIVIFALLFRHKNKLKKLNEMYAKLTRKAQRDSKKAFLLAIEQHNYVSAMEHLYRYAQQIKVPILKNSKLVIRLNQLAFDRPESAQTMPVFSHTQAQQLLKSLARYKPKISHNEDNDKVLKLNS